jgi:hypothetical protein
MQSLRGSIGAAELDHRRQSCELVTAAAVVSSVVVAAANAVNC